MNKLIRCIIPALAVLALLTVSTRTSAQDWTGNSRIEGKVVDAGGNPVQGATVRLRIAESNEGPDVKTDKHGEFSALGLRGGTWNIDVQAPGYIVQRLSVPLPGGEGRIPPLKIELKKNVALEQQQKLQGLLAQGDELYKQGRFAEARAEYEKVLAERPDLVEVHRSIALTYGREHDYADALKQLDIVLQQEPDNLQLLQLAADAALQLGDTGRAEQYASRIDLSKLKDPTPVVNLAINMLNKSQPTPAVQTLDPVIAQFPSDADPYYYRALAELQLQQMDKAKTDLQKFVALAPPDSKEAGQAKQLLSQMKQAAEDDSPASPAARLDAGQRVVDPDPGRPRAACATVPAYPLKR